MSGATDDEAGCARQGGIGAVEPEWTVGARELGSRRSEWPRTTSRPWMDATRW